MTHLLLVFVAYAALVFDTTLRQPLAWGPAAPSFLGLAAVTALMTSPGSAALVWAALIGLLADCASGGALGVKMFAASLTAFVFLRVCPSRPRPSLLSVFSLTFLFVLVWMFSSQTLVDVLAGRTKIVATAGTAAATALYTSGIAVVLMGLRRIVPTDD